MPIRIHLTLWYTFLLGIILITFSTLLFLVLKFSLHAQIDSNLKDRAQQVKTNHYNEVLMIPLILYLKWYIIFRYFLISLDSIQFRMKIT